MIAKDEKAETLWVFHPLWGCSPVAPGNHSLLLSLGPGCCNVSVITSESFLKPCFIISSHLHLTPGNYGSCNPTDCSPPGSSVHEILQARTLEWGVIPFSRGSSFSRDPTQLSHIAGTLYHLSHQEASILIGQTLISNISSMYKRLGRSWGWLSPWHFFWYNYVGGSGEEEANHS